MVCFKNSSYLDLSLSLFPITNDPNWSFLVHTLHSIFVQEFTVQIFVSQSIFDQQTILE